MKQYQQRDIVTPYINQVLEEVKNNYPNELIVDSYKNCLVISRGMYSVDKHRYSKEVEHLMGGIEHIMCKYLKKNGEKN